MSKTSVFALWLLFILCVALTVVNFSAAPTISSVQAQTPAAKPSPSEGYTIHVTAPHVVHGKVMGPFHHYCKVMSDDPRIVCLIYDSADPNAMLSQVEWIWAKKLTRRGVALKDWNANWHDHQQEISTGRVQVLDLPPDKAKEVADLVATTDGLIYDFGMKSGIPDGTMSIAQSVGHKPMTEADYKKSAIAEESKATPAKKK
jgi:hypothetical protein